MYMYMYLRFQGCALQISLYNSCQPSQIFQERPHLESSKSAKKFLFSLHDSVVIHSTSGSDIHDGRAEVVFFYSVYRFFSGDWRHNTSEYS